MDEETLNRIKFYTPEGCHPRLPYDSEHVLALYRQAMLHAANKADIPAMLKAKTLLFYCLN